MTISNKDRGINIKPRSSKVLHDVRNRFDFSPLLVTNIVTDWGAVGDGSNSSAAFGAFRDWAQQQHAPILLIIPPGNYSALMGSVQNAWTFGVKHLSVNAYGATIDEIWLGGIGQTFDNTHSTRIATVLAGAQQVQLLVTADYTKYAAGRWVVITGFDLQSLGGPSNPHVFEYAQILSSNSSGVVVLTTPLQNTYKSTWPDPPSQGSFDEGGPSTIYALGASWDGDLYINGLTVNATSAYGALRHVEIRDMTFLNINPAPSQAILFKATNCTFNAAIEVEVDKLINSLVFENCSGHLVFQSACINTCTLNNCTFTNVNGSPKNILIQNNCTLTPSGVVFGSMSYGLANTFLAKDSSVAATDFYPKTVLISNVVDLGGGVLSIPFNDVNSPGRWLVPGAHIIYVDGNADRLNYGNAFTILEVGQSGSAWLLYTDLIGSLSPLTGVVTPHRLALHPCWDVTFENCSGGLSAIELSQYQAHRPAFEYIKRTYQGNFNRFNPPEFARVWGEMIMTVDVIKPYSGVQTSLMMDLGGNGDSTGLMRITDQNMKTTHYWTPWFDLKTAGTRVISAGSVVGLSGSDVIPVYSSMWSSDGLVPTINHDIGGENSSVYPLVTIEVTARQAA